MDYQRIYNQLMDRSLRETDQRLISKKSGLYFEGHHIIPRSHGGKGRSNNINHPNIVLLTAREHFLAHWLLHRIYPDDAKLAHAFWQMCSWKRNYQDRIRPNSRIYEEAKEAISKIVSKRFKGTIIPEERKIRISNALTGRKRPAEVGQKISKTQKGREGTHKGWITVTNGELEKRIPDMSLCPKGWIRGRKKSARNLISMNQKGKRLSEETKQKMSESAKRYRLEHGSWNKGLTYKIK